MSKVAIITGGCSGMGLEVAKLLHSSGSWSLHLLDFNDAAAKTALASISSAHYHKVDVTDYASLGLVYQAVFDAEKKIDFVFANAGIVERKNFYEVEDTRGSEPPAVPNLSSLTVNLNGVINTTHLAMHYMRLSSHKGQGASIVMTASCGGIYPSDFSPVYAASKAGVINFMRSISPTLHKSHGIRCYAICPGTVRTNLLLPSEWEAFPSSFFTPVSKIASTVVMLEKGGQLTDSKGRVVQSGKDYGLTVEVCGENHYFRDQLPWCDDAMRQVMEATSVENQTKSFEEAKARERAAQEKAGVTQTVMETVKIQ
ncbi:short chain dehydrogenase domain-containing protein [Sarocladium implicatum]|nr:short chain dehydrogenase domain-containing protein [Sarocladium implicatum]